MQSSGRQRVRQVGSPPDGRGELVSPSRRAGMLIALLAIGVAVSVPSIVANALQEHASAALVEGAFVAGKLACLALVWRRRAPSEAAVGAIVAYNTVCVAATNLLYPGPNPFTAQLLLGVVFVAWFLPVRHMAVQLAWLGAAAMASVIGAEPVVPEALRVLTVVLTGVAMATLVRAVRVRLERLRTQATRDALTGVGNRLAYEEYAPLAFAHAQRFGEPLSLVLLDLDGFKQLNDTLGHPAGDEELRAVARLLSHAAREQDSVFRLGGDEFALLLPGTSASGGAAMCDELLERGRRAGIQLRTTLTAGIAQYPLSGHGDSAEGLTRAADSALLAGKREGKARVTIAASAPTVGCSAPAPDPG